MWCTSCFELVFGKKKPCTAVDSEDLFCHLCDGVEPTRGPAGTASPAPAPGSGRGWNPLENARILLVQQNVLERNTVLYDSKTVVPPAGGRGRRVRTDAEMFTEMMFGAAPMKYTGVTTKVHVVKGPPYQMLITKLFGVNVVGTVNPPGEPEGRPAAPSFHGDPMIAEQLQSVRQPLLKNMGAGHARKNSSDSVASSTAPPSTFHMRPVFGLGLLFAFPPDVAGADEARRVVFSHFPLIEMRLTKLMASMEAVLRHEILNEVNVRYGAGHHPGVCHQPVPPQLSLPSDGGGPLGEPLRNFRESLASMFSAPRLRFPLWLAMCTAGAVEERRQARGLGGRGQGGMRPGAPLNSRERYEVAFVERLVDLVSRDARRTAFVASVVTGVLTFHRTWVGSVLTEEEKERYPQLVGGKDSAEGELGAMSRQLLNLYGMIGKSDKQMGRVVVVGKNEDDATSLLVVLSFLIRCRLVGEIGDDCLSTLPEMPHANTLPLPEPLVSGALDHQPDLPPPNRTIDIQNPLAQACADNLAEAEEEGRGAPSSLKDSNGVPFKTPPGSVAASVDLMDVRFPRNAVPITDSVSALTSQPPLPQMTLKAGDTHRPPSIQNSPYFGISPSFRPHSPGASAHNSPRFGSQGLGSPRRGPVTSAPPAFPKATPARAARGGYGRSVFAGYCDKYAGDFVLMATPHFNFYSPMAGDLRVWVKYPVALASPVDRASCVVANMNTLSADVYTCTRSTAKIAEEGTVDLHAGAGGETVKAAKVKASLHIVDTLVTMKHMHQTGLPAPAIIEYLHDRLHEVFTRSLALSAYVAVRGNGVPTCEVYSTPPRGPATASPDLKSSSDRRTLRSLKHVAEEIGVDATDLPLLAAVARMHDDNVATVFPPSVL